MKVHVARHVARTPIIEFCIDAIPELGSRTAVKRAIAKELIMLNGRVAVFKDKVQGGDLIDYAKPTQRKVKKLHIPIDIVYSDDHIVIVNKPGGLAVNGLRHKTVENALTDYNSGNKGLGVLDRPISVHRIDVPTCGLVVLARTKQALIGLSRDFENRKVDKEYTALVHSRITEEGIIDKSIDGQSAETHYRRIDFGKSRLFGHLSLVKVKPITGRTHQIRIHLMRMGHLIVGDKYYARNQKTILGKGLMLCASSITFTHPITKKSITVEIDPPSKFQKTLDRERDRS